MYPTAWLFKHRAAAHSCLFLLFFGRSWPSRNVCLTTVCLPQVPGGIWELVRDGENNAGTLPAQPDSLNMLPSPGFIRNLGFTAPQAGCSAVLPAPWGRVSSLLWRMPKLCGSWAAFFYGAEPQPYPLASVCLG